MGWFYGFKLHLVCNDRGELLNFCLTKGNVDDRDAGVFNVLSRKLFGDLFADKGTSQRNCSMFLGMKGYIW